VSRPTAEDRLRRLLALIPWIEARGSAPVEDVCARFGFTEAELQEELGLLFVCGVHPYQPDDLIYAEILDGEVSIAYAEWFRRPLRLTPAQGLVLVTAAGGLLSIPGTDPEGPLARALEKVGVVLGVEPGEGPEVELGDVDEQALAVLQDAVARHRQVVIDHYSFGADRWAERVVDPWLVYTAGGPWYLRGYCHLASAPRVFRVDRMRSVRATDTSFEPPDDPGPTTVYERGPDDPVVALEVEPAGAWVAARYPNEGLEDLGDGRLRIRLPVGERAWLERLLLALGPDGRVVEAPADLTGVGPAAAARLLGRYQ
jgi:proteasome accessory factor C